MLPWHMHPDLCVEVRGLECGKGGQLHAPEQHVVELLSHTLISHLHAQESVVEMMLSYWSLSPTCMACNVISQDL
jgi:hypothetical protein